MGGNEKQRGRRSYKWRQEGGARIYEQLWVEGRELWVVEEVGRGVPWTVGVLEELWFVTGG